MIIYNDSVLYFILEFPHYNPYFHFQGLAKNLEQPDIKDWLGSTKDMLMKEKSGKDQDSEAEKLTAILTK